jgi:CRISPR-associated endonuclease Cas1
MAASTYSSLLREDFSPILPRAGVVTLFGFGSSVCVDKGHLVVEERIGSLHRRGRFPRVGHRLRRLVVIGFDGTVSFSALRWLADQDASFVMLDRLGKVLATTGPVSSSDARLRRAQALAGQSEIGLAMAKELISQKLVGQQRVALKYFQSSTATFAIMAARNKLAIAESSEDILRCEADGAQAYWKAWHELPIAYPRVDMPRVPDHWKKFGSRMSALTQSPRLAVNPPNAMLNYLYALLESEARLALASLGLDPGIGVLHKDTRNRDSLASDVLEAVRPQVDAFLLDWLTREPLRRQWFLEERNGNCRLMSSLASRLSETCAIWRRAVAPFAEGIARALWSKRSRSEATRLTQNEKRAAKGILSDIDLRTPQLRYSTCRLCGTEVRHTQKYCRDCVPKIVRENVLKAGRLGRQNTHRPEAQSRRSETQRRQNAALNAWHPKDKPDWLDEQTYRSQIRPRLLTVQVPRIAAAILVSEPYALRIRAARCIPHPRHWLTLARLVGVQREMREESRAFCPKAPSTYSFPTGAGSYSVRGFNRSRHVRIASRIVRGCRSCVRSSAGTAGSRLEADAKTLTQSPRSSSHGTNRTK